MVLATLIRVDGFHHRRLLSLIGNILPSEAEAICHPKGPEQKQAA